MNELILHHYAMSPFAEKVRLILGFKKLAWRSVTIPNVLPKPDAVALTGGYRRTPFLQIGADIYCDSALMCRVIDARQPEPALYPAATAGIADIVAQWADSVLFWSAVPHTMQPAGVVHVLKGASPETLKAFGADRAAMNPNLRRPSIADGGAAVHTYLARIEQMLSAGQPFLLGAQPSIADFSAVHPLWFMHLAPPIASLLDAYPRLTAWYARVTAFGQGTPTVMTALEAISVSAGAADARAYAALSFTAEPGLTKGDAVTVTPTDYAHDAVEGTLVGLTRDEVVLARIDERAGLVHVHFPRLGFQIKLHNVA